MEVKWPFARAATRIELHGSTRQLNRGRLLVGEHPAQRKRPQPGNCKGMLTIIAEDDEHLKDFADYMQ